MDEELTTSKVARLAEVQGLAAANTVPGVIVIPIDDRWTAAVNGHSHAVMAQLDHCMLAELEPFEIGFWYQGWFAGALRPFKQGEIIAEQGVIASGEAANEATLRAALDAALERGQ